MSSLKRYKTDNVLEAAQKRVRYVFDHFERIYVSFSGGKDSTVMMHLVLQEARRRDRKVGVLIIDLEAQYSMTIAHLEWMVDHYRDCIDLHWVCLPLLLRNAVTNYEPRWVCWEPGKEAIWVRQRPACAIGDPAFYPFFEPEMEFEEFMVLFGLWYGRESDACGFVGIRCDESLNRFRTIASKTKETHGGKRFTTKVEDGLYNCYPLYDWRTEDIWRYHARYPEAKANEVYEAMFKAGVPISQQRLCQPYGDDQRKGLWLYHILEPDTWFKLIARVNGANSGAIYVEETGNVMGYGKISKPADHTWHSFCNLLLESLPKKTRDHYIGKFKTFIAWWKKRGYADGMPDEAPVILESKRLAPSWRRLCKVLLRNDYWCKGLNFSQPKSEAYGRYLEIKKSKKLVSTQISS